MKSFRLKPYKQNEKNILTFVFGLLYIGSILNQYETVTTHRLNENFEIIPTSTRFLGFNEFSIAFRIFFLCLGSLVAWAIITIFSRIGLKTAKQISRSVQLATLLILSVLLIYIAHIDIPGGFLELNERPDYFAYIAALLGATIGLFKTYRLLRDDNVSGANVIFLLIQLTVYLPLTR